MISLSFLVAGPLFIAASQSPQEQLSSSLRRERIEQIRAGYLNASEERRVAALELFSGVRSAANPTGGSLASVRELKQRRYGGYLRHRMHHFLVIGEYVPQNVSEQRKQ